MTTACLARLDSSRAARVATPMSSRVGANETCRPDIKLWLIIARTAAPLASQEKDTVRCCATSSVEGSPPKPRASKAPPLAALGGTCTDESGHGRHRASGGHGRAHNNVPRHLDSTLFFLL